MKTIKRTNEMVEYVSKALSEDAYLLEAKQFVSREYHDEIIFPFNLEFMFREAIVATKRADMVKKSLFYGKEFRGKQFPNMKTRIKHNKKYNDLLHAVLGVFTEAGELLEHMYNVMGDRCTVDFVNFNEELGDLYWYIALIHNTLGTKPSESWVKNIDKLKARYGEQFVAKRALYRDLDKERRVLEK